jgi:AcrR family transcriptional regulator
MPDTARPYHSPLREEQTRATRERILDALLALQEAAPEAAEITVDAVATAAGVQRRTVFRHFATRDALLEAAFAHLNARMGLRTAPADRAALVVGPREAFPTFDAFEGAVRAALHGRAGREMRARSVAARRRAFAACLERDLAGQPAAVRNRVLALAHLLYSASAWEVLKDYGSLTGAEAGEAASWALETILSAIGSGEAAADAPSQAKE